MTTVLSPSPKQQFFDNNGQPMVGGLLFVYEAGTSTKATTWTDSTGTTPNSNPVVLDYRGECNLWIEPNVAYKYVLAPPTDTDPPSNPVWSVDQVKSQELLTLYGGVDTGSANAYVLNFTASFTAYTDGIVIYWIPSNTNTGASTLNVNGLGIVNIKNPDGSDLYLGQLQANQFACVIYSSGVFQLYTFGLLPKIKLESGDYTFAITDGQGIVAAPSTAIFAMTWTIPPNSSVAFPIGTSMDLVNNGAADITLAAGPGVTISGYGVTIPHGGCACKIIKIATDTWQVVTVPYVKLTGSFTGTLTGMTGSVTGSISWDKGIDGVVTLRRSGGAGSISGTSNATSMTLTGMPSSLWPKFTTLSAGYGVFDNGGSTLPFVASISDAGVVTFLISANPPASFTGSGTKGLSGGWQMTYSL